MQVRWALVGWIRAGAIRRRPWANRGGLVVSAGIHQNAPYFVLRSQEGEFVLQYMCMFHVSLKKLLPLFLRPASKVSSSGVSRVECVAKARGDPQARPETTTLLAGSSLLVVDREKERRPACVGINPPRRPDRTIAGTDKSIHIRYYLLSPARRPPSIFCLSAVPASVRATAAPPPAALSVCYCVTYASRELAAQQGPLCRPFRRPPSSSPFLPPLRLPPSFFPCRQVGSAAWPA